MNDKVENIGKKWPTWVILISITLALLWINYNSFNAKLSANNELITDYQLHIDELEAYRISKIAGILYKTRQSLQKPALIIAPDAKYLPILRAKYAQNDESIETLIMDLNQKNVLEEAKQMVKEQNLYPLFIELNSLEIGTKKQEIAPNKIQNIKSFIYENEAKIIEIVNKSLNYTKDKPFTVARKNFDEHLFDLGNVFVFDTYNVESGSLNIKVGVGQDIANNIYSAIKQGLNTKSFRIAFLSEFEPINYNSEADLLEQISQNNDGIVIRDGYRQAVFLPYMWKKYPDKQDFINNLKLKATLLPNYFSNTIKFYKFQTVEISIANQ